jgi:hypothetical protein
MVLPKMETLFTTGKYKTWEKWMGGENEAKLPPIWSGFSLGDGIKPNFLGIYILNFLILIVFCTVVNILTSRK